MEFTRKIKKRLPPRPFIKLGGTTNLVKIIWAGLVNQIKLSERPENFFRGVEKNFLHPKKPKVKSILRIIILL